MNRNHAAKQFLRLVIAAVCVTIVAATAEASQPPEDAYAVPDSVSLPLGRRYYGAVDPHPIGYYPFAYYQGSAFPVGRAVGYYPYPDAHPYVVPFPYPYGYYGGYGAWPYSGYPGWGWGWSPFPFGFGF